jgi:uncharacterized protein
MKFEWDEVKAAANLAKHGVSFEAVIDFDWNASVDTPDHRKNYNEQRVIATSTIRGRPHVLVYVQRNDCVRVISLRKANKREFSKYEKAQ